MKIVSIYAAVPDLDNEISKIGDIIKSILFELNAEITEIKLLEINLPPYSGEINPEILQITDKIKNSDGVIFLSCVHIFNPCSIMQNFFDYLSNSKFKNILCNKNCLIALSSLNGGEKQGVDYIAKVINILGGFDTIKIPLNFNLINKLKEDDTIKIIVEKQIEDFYRFINQNRSFIIPSENLAYTNLSSELSPHIAYELNEHQKEILQNTTTEKKLTVSDIYEKYNLSSFNELQNQDIDEITQLFSKKYDEVEANKNKISLENNLKPQNENLFFNEQLDKINDYPPVPRTKTCKQLTSSLPHRFLSQQANGLNACFQLNITGNETFDCTITISNTECYYEEGIMVNPDITIIADSDVWTAILKGSQTSQKSFMIGQIKVRGNFVLLTKFDQLFKHGM